jgi:hypothetical protein
VADRAAKLHRARLRAAAVGVRVRVLRVVRVRG